jgi:hypothetical protein
MKRLITLTVMAVLLTASGANATIGWAGNVYPNDGAEVVPIDDLNCYVQVWKSGVTDAAGQGDSIEVVCDVSTDNGFWPLDAVYNTDVGNNDEYVVTIDKSYLASTSTVSVYFKVLDLTDDTVYEGTNDQNGHSPPQTYTVSDVVVQDVTVYFSLCLPDGVDSAGGVCITGGAEELSSWGNGVLMTQPCPETSPKFYQVGITFAAGSNPYVEYKYRKDGCTTWESTGNHSVTIDDSGSVYIIPVVDHWEYYDGEDCPECGVNSDESSWGAAKSIYR